MDIGRERHLMVETFIRQSNRVPAWTFDEAKRVLEETHWDLEGALALHGGRGGGRGEGRGGGCWGWVMRVVGAALRPWLGFFGTLLPGGGVGGGRGGALATHRQFLLGYEAEHGMRHPVFFAGNMFEAAKEAKRAGKLLFVYLHAGGHADTALFCRGALAHEAVVEFLDRNAVAWGAEAGDAMGFEAAAALRATRFPFCAVLHCGGESGRGQELECLEVWQGAMNGEELLQRLLQTWETHEELVERERRAVEHRQQSRTLVREQDREYERALRADRERQEQQERKAQQKSKQEEEEEEARQVAAAVAAVAAAMPPPRPSAPPLEENNNNNNNKGKGKEEEEGDKKKKQKNVEVPEEPAAGAPDAVHVAFRLPSSREERRFSKHDTLRTVYAWVDSRGVGSAPYVLVSPHPRHPYPRSDTSLQDAGFSSKMALIYEETDE